MDLHLFGEGKHRRLWELLGAHLGAEGGATFAEVFALIASLEEASGSAAPANAVCLRNFRREILRFIMMARSAGNCDAKKKDQWRSKRAIRHFTFPRSGSSTNSNPWALGRALIG